MPEAVPDPYRKRIAPTALEVDAPEKRPLGKLRREVGLNTDAMKPSILGYIAIAAWLTFGLVAGGPAGLLGALVVGTVIVAVRQAELVSALFRRVSLHSGGIVYRQLSSRGTVLFDDVDEVFIDSLPGAGWSGVRLREHGGKVHEIGLLWHDPAGCSALGNSIILECSLCHLESAKEALASGERLEFGPLAIDASAAHFTLPGQQGRVEVRWTELRNVWGFDNVLTFAGRNGKFHVIAVRDVPHPNLLIALLKELAVWHDGPPPVLPRGLKAP